MTRIFGLIALAIALLSAVNANTLKIETAGIADDIGALTRQIQEEKDQIALLKAEWNYLIRPRRIQDLADRHLPLEVLDPTHSVPITALHAIPMRVKPGEDAAEIDHIAALLQDQDTE